MNGNILRMIASKLGTLFSENILLVLELNGRKVFWKHNDILFVI